MALRTCSKTAVSRPPLTTRETTSKYLFRLGKGPLDHFDHLFSKRSEIHKPVSFFEPVVNLVKRGLDERCSSPVSMGQRKNVLAVSRLPGTLSCVPSLPPPWGCGRTFHEHRPQAGGRRYEG